MQDFIETVRFGLLLDDVYAGNQISDFVKLFVAGRSDTRGYAASCYICSEEGCYLLRVSFAKNRKKRYVPIYLVPGML